MDPFAVSSNGNSVQTAIGPDSLLAADKPLTKLDTTKIESFQTISILFNHEPPQPTFTTSTDTLLYQFAHGYDYIPAIWMTWQNPAPAFPSDPPVSGTATTFYAFGDETAAANIPGVGGATSLSLLSLLTYNDPFDGVNAYTNAFIYVIVDKTNVSIYLRKSVLKQTSSGTDLPIFIIGLTVNMRVYVFTEPATTSTY